MSDMKDLSQLNAALAASSMPTRVTALMRLLSTKQSMLTMLNSLSQEYSNMYSKLQLLKYDQNNDPIDVTTANALTAIDTTIALYKQSWATAKSTVNDLEELLDRLNPEEVNNYTAISINDECSSLTPLIWQSDQDEAFINRVLVEHLVTGLRNKILSWSYTGDILGVLPYLHYSTPCYTIGDTDLYNPRDPRIQRSVSCATIYVVLCNYNGSTTFTLNLVVELSRASYTGKYTTTRVIGTQPSGVITCQAVDAWLGSIDIVQDFDLATDKALLIGADVLTNIRDYTASAASIPELPEGFSNSESVMTFDTVGDHVSLVDKQMIESVDIRALDAALEQL